MWRIDVEQLRVPRFGSPLSALLRCVVRESETISSDRLLGDLGRFPIPSSILSGWRGLHSHLLNLGERTISRSRNVAGERCGWHRCRTGGLTKKIGLLPTDHPRLQALFRYDVHNLRLNDNTDEPDGVPQFDACSDFDDPPFWSAPDSRDYRTERRNAEKFLCSEG